MQVKTMHTIRKSEQGGNVMLEFAIVMTILIPMFAGAFTMGMALAKGIQVSNTARDAAVLMVSTNTNPNAGLDLSQAQNQRIIVRAAQGLGMALDAQNDPNPNGLAVVILSKVVNVGPNECTLAGLSPHGSAPFWDTSNCPNFGSYAFEYRVVIGNGSRWSSTLGNPGVTVLSNGTISVSNIASNTADQDSTFNSVTGLTLGASNYALVAEMYADVTYLNFFNVMSHPTLYARSIS
jgi:Flp pilus assembly protein TadG